MTDIDLLRQYAERGAHDAFAQVVKRHVDFVYSAARRRARNDTDLADEITQRVFILLARKAARLDRRVHVGGWLYNAVQLIAQELFREQRRRAGREREAAGMAQEHRKASAPSPKDEVLENAEEALDDAMNGLDERTRGLLILHFFEGKTFREMAQILGIREDAARKRVSRALGQLREIFARRGLAMPAEAIGDFLVAQAVISAPEHVVRAAQGASTTAITIKTGAGIVALAKTKMAAIIALTVVLATGGTAVVRKIADRSSDGASLPSQASHEDWKTAFAKTYTLGPGETARHVAPPFIPQRRDFFRSVGFDALGPPPSAQTVLILESPALVKASSFLGNEGYQLAIKSMGIWLQDIDAPAALFKRRVPGDWVFRTGATKAQRLDALARIISAETGERGRFVLKQVQRDAIVVSGKFAYAPLPGVKVSGKTPEVHVFETKLGPITGHSIAQTPGEMLQQLGELLDIPVVIESDLPAKMPVMLTWHLPQTRDGVGRRVVDAPAIQANVMKQTSLQLRRERRVVPIWTWEASGEASP
jgi:RNA polymerase sigma factor (sigma-70 family)